MRLLTRASVVTCGHGGVVQNVPSQQHVTIGGVPVLVEDDPVGRVVLACPNYGLSLKPCTTTRAVRTGYSTFVTVGGRPVCLDTLEGVTDGVDAQVVLYTLRDARQQLVGAGS